MNRLVAILAIVVTALLLAACSMSADTAIAEQAVPQFHASLDAGDFDAIYTAASDDFKKATTQVEFVALLDAVHRRLGATKSSTRQGWAVNYGGGTVVTLTYATTFDAGEAVEEFVYRLDGKRATLAGYHIAASGLPGQRAKDGGGTRVDRGLFIADASH